LNQDAAVEQRRREGAKAENKAMLTISPKSETFTWQVKAKPLPNLRFPGASSPLRAFVIHIQLRSLG
jgi:hypothetical protein